MLFYFKEKSSQDVLDFNVGLGFCHYFGYENNHDNWKAYKLDLGPEIVIDNGIIGLGIKTNFIIRNVMTKNIVVNSYHVDDENKKIYPEYYNKNDSLGIGLGLGLMLYSAKIPYLNSRLFCDSGCNLWDVGKSDYTYVFDVYVRLGLLYAIW